MVKLQEVLKKEIETKFKLIQKVKQLEGFMRSSFSPTEIFGSFAHVNERKVFSCGT